MSERKPSVWAGTSLARWSECLSGLLGRAVVADAVHPLGRQGAKAHGMTASAEVAYAEPDGSRGRCFVKWPDFSLYGQDLACDSWREVLWRLEGYEGVPGHGRCLGVVRVLHDGALERVDVPVEGCLLVEEAVAGQLYADRLAALSAGQEQANAIEDAKLVCRHMVQLHRHVPTAEPRHYRRMLREWIIDMALRVMDGGGEYWDERQNARREIEHLLVDWRHRLLGFHRRLRTVHHDFHPWNIFIDVERVGLIGARIPGFGDPASDFAAITLNYVLFGYLTSPRFGGVFERLLAAYWQEYLRLTNDEDLRVVLPAFFGSRLLVFLSPAFYPDLSPAVRTTLERLAVQVLRGEIDVLEPGALD